MTLKISLRMVTSLLLCIVLWAGAFSALARQESRVSIHGGAQQMKEQVQEDQAQDEDQDGAQGQGQGQAQGQSQGQDGAQGSGSAGKATESTSEESPSGGDPEQEAAAALAHCRDLAVRQFAQDRSMARVDYNECRRNAVNLENCDIQYQEALATIDEKQSNWVIMNCHGDPEEFYKNRP